MNNDNYLQDPFLALLKERAEQVSIYLVNGIKLTGVVDAYDSDVVFLKNNISQMVYKHAISTVVPSAAVKVSYHQNAQGRFEMDS